MPRWVTPVLWVVGALALLPLACIARSRAVPSAAPRVHLVQDMDNQGKFKTQQANPLFADRRAMRPPVAGTVARGQLGRGSHHDRGLVDGAYAETFPLPLTPELLARGRERFDIYCAPCHGLAGYGDGPVSRRADRLQQGTWVPPASLHAEPASTRPVGHLFNSITRGVRSMPSYAAQLAVDDRWAIVAYVRALQRSQDARPEDLPAAERERLLAAAGEGAR